MTPTTPGASRRRFLLASAAWGLATPAALAAAAPAHAAPTRTAGRAPTGAPPGTPPPGARARVVRENRVDERITDLTLASPALGEHAAVRLLTPRGWHPRPAHGRCWPTLYLLPEGGGDHLSWTDHHRIQDLASLHDTLVVMPAMPLYGFYTDWWNHGAGGPPRVESFHLREVIPLMERDYGAGPRRAAAGESQGGFGALSYTARHPGLFRAAASYSGFVHPLLHPHAVRAGMTYLGMDWLALWGHPDRQRHLWAAHDPACLTHRYAGVPVYLSCGDGRLGPLDPPDTEPDDHIPGLEDPDNPFPDDVLSPTEAIMREENEALAPLLRAAGARLTTHFHAGTHDPPYWARELRASLPMLLDALHG
ncbi:alpha/beta hydrolase [Streptomyces sp. WMMC897]|uniref:alpha/beta hydrolase n=1 Tax=Streptomyces sp. WMMC897 TaxID=3014782 RepID=UPI0022B6DE33|nr:alpha/beta hydrolase-fold protein [Streptomyces sp. WMMC897]MCZ7415249.1 alpha/beta hydrolase-fold protein [Streptomyces sp. WMMC897]